MYESLISELTFGSPQELFQNFYSLVQTGFVFQEDIVEDLPF
jgi:hypothetical protein